MLQIEENCEWKHMTCLKLQNRLFTELQTPTAQRRCTWSIKVAQA